MDILFTKYKKKLARTPMKFIRSFINEVDWNNRIIGIKGTRGVGKTTLLLQYAKLHLKEQKSLYVSLDDFYFLRKRLYALAENFIAVGGKVLLLDEIHRYPNWSQELKNIYDDFPSLKIIYTGSSILHLSKGMADLSRRSILYTLHGLSFREFLDFTQGYKYEKISLHQLLETHTKIALSITNKIKPLEYFSKYLEYGYYPFFKENVDTYGIKLQGTVNLLIEDDFPKVFSITYSTAYKIKKFLAVIAESVPFKPNLVKLSNHLELNRNDLTVQLHNLQDAGLLHLLTKTGKGNTRLQKPEKVFLGNTNLSFVLNDLSPNTGSLRETFFLSQLKPLYEIHYSDKADFFVDHKYTIEVGGRHKNLKQIQGVPDSFIAMDNLEVGHGQKIPLWLFGFLR